MFIYLLYNTVNANKGLKMITITELPSIEGTEKQISWALKIRDKKIKEYNNDLIRIHSQMKKVPEGSEYFKKCQMWKECAEYDLNSFITTTSAQWIIANRN